MPMLSKFILPHFYYKPALQFGSTTPTSLFAQQPDCPNSLSSSNQGTADAIRRCLWMLEEYPVGEFLVLPGHHLYKMDYQKLIDAHRRSKADITVSNSCFGNGSSFYDRDSPLYTLPRHLPPTLVQDAVITDSVIGDGCILSKCRIKGTVVGMRTKIGNDAVVEDSIIIGSDVYQHASNYTTFKSGVSKEETVGIPIGIGEGSHIRKAIVDKNARIGKNVMIINKDNVQEGNREANGYIISEGIIVIIRSAVIPDGIIL